MRITEVRGGVGIAAIQLAKRAGATVFTTASSDEKLARELPRGAANGVWQAQLDALIAAAGAKSDAEKE